MTRDIKRWAHGYGELEIARSGCPEVAPAPGRKSAGWLLIVLAFSGSAHAAPDAGPTSAASIKISVSVAPRYTLRAAAAAAGSSQVGLERAEPGRFCLKTNALALQLPVMLVWQSGHEGSASGPAAKEKAVEVPPCDAPGEMTLEVGRVDQLASGMLIVRPE
jgi:hypothetical protein